jgi:peptidoglycan hydrolase-like protein with peptidoglycan-binding domain
VLNVTETIEHGSEFARRRRWIASVAVAAVLLAGGGFAAGRFIKSPAELAAEAGPPVPDVLTAAVESRVLTSTVVTRGTVIAGQSIDVAPLGAGSESGATPIVTRLLLKAGDSVRPGQLLLEVSGRPVVALPGTLPVYRDVKPGDTGRDVAQLQRALAKLGYGLGVDQLGYFGLGTKRALASYYAHLGYDPLPANPDGDQQIASAQDAVTQAYRAWQDAAAGREKTRAAEDLQKARVELRQTEALNGPMLPASEVVYLDRFPARVDALLVDIGSRVTGTVMTVSSGPLVVEGYLEQGQKGLVRTGQKVQILAELLGATEAATVQSVASTQPTQANQGGQQATPLGYRVVVRPDKQLPSSLLGQDVRLTIEAASTNHKVLVVPVAAISASADGKTVVTVLRADGTQQRVEVTVGVTGDGFVEVRPTVAGSIAPGNQVVAGIKGSAQ